MYIDERVSELRRDERGKLWFPDSSATQAPEGKQAEVFLD